MMTVMIGFAVVVVLFAYASVGLAIDGTLPADIMTLGIGLGVLALVFHLVVRVVAAYANDADECRVFLSMLGIGPAKLADA